MSVRGLFVTGTNTEVGKTFVSCLIARELVDQGQQVGVYKPAESGFVDEAESGADSRQLWEAAGRPAELDRVCPQRFRAPLAPHLAARQEGREIDPGLLREGVAYWERSSQVVLVEGAGGLLSPISDEELVADIAVAMGYPLIIVAANQLGVINQTLQTLVAAQSYRLPVAAVVLNDYLPERDDASLELNLRELIPRCSVPVVRLRHAARQCDDPLEWFNLAAPANPQTHPSG